MVRDWKVLLFVAYRTQMLYKMVSESPLGLTDVEEATLGAADTVDQVGRCAGEPLSGMKGLSWALNGGEGGGVGADVAVAEELGVGDHILAGGWVRGGVVLVAVGVNGFEIDVGVEAVTRDGDRDVPEGEG
eukprot:g26416.t1